MDLNQILGQIYSNGVLALSIAALAIAIVTYPTIKANLEEGKKKKKGKKK